MIVKLSVLSNSKYLSNHLASDENERVTDTGTRGVLADDIPGTLAEFEALGKGSRAEKHLVHISVSPSPGEEMNPEKWARVWELVDQVHGTGAQPYRGVGHDKNDRYHEHRVYSRILQDTGKALNFSWTKVKNERISRQSEAEFGHKIVQGKHNRAVAKALRKEGLNNIAAQVEQLAQLPPQVTLYNHEEHQAEKRGITLSQVRHDLAQAWAISDNVQAFVAALAEKGYTLAQGDKVPVAIDSDGREYPLLRAINAGRKAIDLSPIRKAELATRLLDKLPYLESVREVQAEQQQITNTRRQKMEGAADLKPRPVPPKKPVDGIEEAEATKEKKKKDKYQILEDYYQRSIHDHRFFRFWRVEEQLNGSLHLENAIGNLVDYGDRINVESQPGKEKLTAIGAVELAKLKGWKSLKVTGSGDFKAAAYKEAEKRGIKIELENERDREIYRQLQDKLKEEQVKRTQLRQKEQHSDQSRCRPMIRGPRLR